MNANVDWALELIAENAYVSIGEVLDTIDLLEAANQIVVVVGDGNTPVLVAVDWEQHRTYLIDDLYRPSEHPVHWALWLRTISEQTQQPVFQLPRFADVALALLFMAAGLNSHGLILDLALSQEYSSTSSEAKILDRYGVRHGVFGMFWNDGILMDTSAEIQTVALRALSSMRTKSENWGHDPLQLQLFSMQHDDLPPDFVEQVRSAPAFVDQLLQNFKRDLKTKFNN